MLRRIRIGPAAGPATVLGGILLLWLALYFAYPPPGREAVAGRYVKLLARGDGHYMYLSTVSLVLDGDLDLRDQFAYGDPWGHARWRTETGRHRIFPIGTSLLQAPLFAAAHGAARVANAFGASVPEHGYTLWHQRVTFLGPLLAGWMALVFGWRLARRYVSEAAALHGVVAVGLGTGLIFYAAYRGSYTHAWSAMAVAWFLCYWDRTRGRKDARRWAALGALVGLAALTRMQEVVVAAVVAAEAAAQAAGCLRRRDARGVAAVAGRSALAAACALAVASPQLAANHLFYGSAFSVWQGEEFMRWDAPFLWHVLFAPRNGLSVWHPLAWAGVLGLLCARRRAWAAAAALLGAFALQWWVCGSVTQWWGAEGFGARRLLGQSAAALAGFAFAVDRLLAAAGRVPVWARHAALAAAMLPFLAANVALAEAAARDRFKLGQPAKLRGADVPAPLGRALSAVNDAVGNPLSWPHNLLWALRHRVSPGRYQDLIGSELLYVDYKRVRPGSETAATVRLSRAGLARHGAGGWTPVPGGGPPAATAAPGARLLLPLFLDGEQRWTVRCRPARPDAAVTFEVNGRHRVTVRPRAGEQDLRIDVPDGVLRVGTNELAIRCDGPGPCLTARSVRLVHRAGGW